MSDSNDGRPVPIYSRGEALAVVSISGGKDSLATALVAIEQLGRERVRLVHADTGNEHEITERYVRDYLPGALRLPIEIVRADFSTDIERKRQVVKTKWVAEGVQPEVIAAALDVLHPTGSPFLDLCIEKGRFPSRLASFCTHELKHKPLDAYLSGLKTGQARKAESWQGIRRDESPNRRDALLWEVGDFGGWIHRPLIHWTAGDVLAIARRHNVEQNPLYLQGMGRVGCMPCHQCSKRELREIARRWPEVIERIRRWEAICSRASKHSLTAFFFFDQAEGRTNIEHASANSIDQAVNWARTSRGGKQLDLEAFTPAASCSSIYGLCE
ncbi:phosphoadenosine phosphosulfate reductase family protein [Asaia sp. As-1742]|uniref:phosphoadenosine phosphosulfate reductase domain-containing protein n=1 Tax=Asaia sp. As-1742 TaxID=2608325 RepID=UPI0014213D31|nr:phosphoadenosine phosphosulfate reductase family protein [Asaia sp. As-1742]NIE80033.1 phosphoadenosine phosphosulfate reductase family protein [Asaia sp. As-1742]